MITVFSCPKAFKGVTRIHQYNAVQSWKRLHPDVQVILVGDDEGVAEASRELGVTHIPECERNDYGTPLISSIFGQARAHARHAFLGYANGDIILTSHFLACFLAVRRRRLRFLLVGKRWDLDCYTRLDFHAPSWERDLISRAKNSGCKASQWQIDYFAFPAAEFRDVPPFAVGRVRWDNWMIWKARAEKAAVVDASAFITAIHQNHDYSHHPQGQKGVWEGPEAVVNHDLAGGWDHVYSIDDATNRILRFRDRPFLSPLEAFRFRSAIRRCLRTLKNTRVAGGIRSAFIPVLKGHWSAVWTKLARKMKKSFSGQ